MQKRTQDRRRNSVNGKRRETGVSRQSERIDDSKKTTFRTDFNNFYEKKK